MNHPTVEPPQRRGSRPGPRPVAARPSRDTFGEARTPEPAPAAVRDIAARAPERSRLAQTLVDFSPLDWLVTAFFTIMTVAVLAGSGPARGESLAILGVDWTALIVGMTLSRGRVLPVRTFANALAYRLTIFGTVVSSYFQLRVILPTVTSRALDASIYAFDLRVFHVEPSLALDRFVTPQTTEWFAFFYFGYFFLLAIHVLPFMFLAQKTRVLANFALGTSIVFCVGHMTYMLVPGYGPYAFLSHEFTHELSGGTFWGLVQEAVRSAGAQKDIFPSLHTAVPTFFAIFAFRYRREQWPFRYTWPVMAFCASQIIGATLFLRWHYLVDIFAGVTLAVTANLVAAKLVAWDERRRAAGALVPAWSRLFVLRRAARASRQLASARPG